MSGIFAPGLFAFLRDLRANNDREWFEANRDRYERQMLEPAMEFIDAFAPRLRRISPAFVASTKRSGGSLFRIHRDVRFSKDKSPYKTHLGIQFRHGDAKDVHAPGFYLHVEPRTSFIGVGIWHPDSSTLAKIRGAIVDDPAKWKRAAYATNFTKIFQLEGDSLVRPPSGYDKEHPFIDDLKRKDFIGVARLPDRTITSSEFLREFESRCHTAGGFMKFLCDAVGVAY